MHRLAGLLLGLSAATLALAHRGAEETSSGIEGVLFLTLLAVLVLGGCQYARGVGALWHKAGVGRGIPTACVAGFILGWGALAGALLSPIDAWTDRSFAVHMIQHELLMVVAAPLIVLGRPLEAWTWAASDATRQFVAAALEVPVVRLPGRLMTRSLGAWMLHAAALWLWHLPALFQAASTHPLLHVLQHTCFFATAIAYWWTVFGGRLHRPSGGAIASLFTTMLHTSALGALLTFSSSSWYVADGIRAFGLSAIEDQQLGGLIMWVPGGLAYLIPGLLIVRRWLGRPHAPIDAQSGGPRAREVRPLRHLEGTLKR